MRGVCLIAPLLGWGRQKPPPGVLLDRGHPLAKGLRFFVPFNEATGSAVNDAVGGKTGKIINSTWPDWQSRRGRLTFDGVDDRVDFPPKVLLPSKPMSVAVKLVLAALPSAYAWVWTVHRADDTSYAVNLHVDDKGRLKLSWAGIAATTRGTTLQMSSNRFYTAVITWNGSGLYTGIRIFVDGKEYSYRAENTGSALYSADGRWSLGNRCFDNTYPFNGALEWLGWWDRVLSPDEIRRLHYEGPWQMFEAELLSACGPNVLGPYLTSAGDAALTGAAAGQPFAAGAACGEHFLAGANVGCTHA